MTYSRKQETTSARRPESLRKNDSDSGLLVALRVAHFYLLAASETGSQNKKVSDFGYEFIARL